LFSFVQHESIFDLEREVPDGVRSFFVQHESGFDLEREVPDGVRSFFVQHESRFDLEREVPDGVRYLLLPDPRPLSAAAGNSRNLVSLSSIESRPQAAAHHPVDNEEPRFSLSKTLAPGPSPGLPRVQTRQIIFFDNGGI
jgi:hypothetical protein